MSEAFTVKVFSGSLIALLTYLLGGLDQALQILLVLILFDYITGFIAGAFNKELSSAVGFKGICKKVMIIFVVAVAVQADRLLGDVGVARLTVIFFYSANEGLSILENATRIGLPLPQFLKDMLRTMKEQSDKGTTLEKDVI
jgi:toxin secretion/phage lysis holin